MLFVREVEEGFSQIVNGFLTRQNSHYDAKLLFFLTFESRKYSQAIVAARNAIDAKPIQTKIRAGSNSIMIRKIIARGMRIATQTSGMHHDAIQIA